MLKIYNTLTRKKEVFVPLKKNMVRMYVCGPTVNDVPHLGHARLQVFFDVIRKYLRFLGYKVRFVSNITDIEDKIIQRAKELNEDIRHFTERNLKAHYKDYSAIGVEKPDVQPRATEYIPQMIKLISKLEHKGYTYIIKGDGVYFDVSKFKGYGKLSRQKIKKLRAGARIKLKESKRNKEDFVLWKFSKPGEPEWSSPWGKGRPGWHIECSAMSATILGLPLDIHGGGQDLIFPHHEDEIAQSEAGYGKKFSNYWIHNGMVNVDSVKMSKSLGNFKTIRNLLKDYSGPDIRYFILSTHYRKPIDFSKKALDNSKNSMQKLRNLVATIKNDRKFNEKYLQRFKKEMDDDLNTPRALRVLWALAKDKNANGRYLTIKKIDEVFGLNLLEKKKIKVPARIKSLIEQREKERKNKNWGEADKIREKIKKAGYLLEDTKKGVVVKKINFST